MVNGAEVRLVDAHAEGDGRHHDRSRSLHEPVLGAGALLVAFRGITDALIPLFAVGAFLSFSLSQAGMAAHWWNPSRSSDRRRGRRPKLFINGFGACVTGAALAIILAAKFTDGAWITILVIPCTILLLRAVKRYYDEADRQVLSGGRAPIDLADGQPPIVLVPITQWDRLAKKALEYARRLSPDVDALHLIDLEGPDAEDREQRLRANWRTFVEDPAARIGTTPPRLRFIPTQYRSMTQPILAAIGEVRQAYPGRMITVVLPELVDRRWWGALMHVNRERRLRATLLRNGGRNLAVSTVPWQLQEPEPEQTAE